MSERKRTIWIILGSIGGLVLLTLVIVGIMFLRSSDIREANNEFDAALAQYRSLGLPWVAADLKQTPPVTADHNAAPMFLKAIADVPEEPRNASLKWADITKREDWAAIRKYLQPLNKGLDEAVLASQRPNLEWDRDYDLAEWVLLPEDAQIKRISKLLMARAELSARDGKEKQALGDLGAIAKMGELVGQSPLAIDHIVSLALTASAVKAAERVSAVLFKNGRSLEGLEHLVASFSDPTAYSQLNHGELYNQIATARNWATYSKFYPFNVDAEEQVATIDPSKVIRSGAPTDYYQRGFLTRCLQHASQIELLRRSTGTNEAAFEEGCDQIQKKLDAHKTLSYKIVQYEFSFLETNNEPRLKTLARLRAIRCLIAGMQFKKSNGRWPKSVAEMPGKWIDPFTNRPLKVKTTAQGFRVYSVGATKVDHGGVDVTEEPSGSFDGDLVESYPPVVSIRH